MPGTPLPELGSIMCGSIKIMFGMYNGKKYFLPESFFTATEEEVDKFIGGCGPGKLGDWLVPDTVYTESITDPCGGHDWGYHIGKDKLDKFYADIFLWVNSVIATCDPFDLSKIDILQQRRITTYFQAVLFGGGGAFDKGEPNNGLDENEKLKEVEVHMTFID